MRQILFLEDWNHLQGYLKKKKQKTSKKTVLQAVTVEGELHKAYSTPKVLQWLSFLWLKVSVILAGSS